jgi:ethanolaminephosphotransferase
MPRIKAMVSGAVPGFLDFIMNIGSKSLTDDNWVYQMKNNGMNIKFYGDDTWIKLFPDHFIDFDGVVSFFVTV